MQKWLKSCISIVIPVYNVEDYLSECVESVCKQTYQNLQIILVDDGSTDKSGQICEELAKADDRIMVIHKENGGLSAARNAGICHATGDYIFYLDSDDYLEIDALETLVQLAEKEHADVAVGNYCYTYSDHETATEFSYGEKELLDNHEAMEALITGKIQNFAWGKLIKRELAVKYQFPKGKLFEDHYWAHLIFGDAQKTAVTNKPLVHYRQRGDSISYTFNIKRLDVLEGWMVRKAYLESGYPDLVNEYMRYVSEQYVQIAWMILTKMHGNRKEAFEILKHYNCKMSLENYAEKETKKKIMLLSKSVVGYSMYAVCKRIIRR